MGGHLSKCRARHCDPQNDSIDKGHTGNAEPRGTAIASGATAAGATTAVCGATAALGGRSTPNPLPGRERQFGNVGFDGQGGDTPQ